MDGYGKRVLIVEDDDTARDMLAAILVQAGYNVHTANDGQGALMEMKRRHFDVVVTDYHMPRLNGMELLSLCRIVWPDTPVVMVSGDPDNISDMAIHQGAQAWIHKPFEASRLLEILRTALCDPIKEHSRNAISPGVE